MTIWGWAALLEFTQLNDQLVRRAQALYDFPKPTKVRSGSKITNVWDEPLVSEWLRKNHMHPMMERRRKFLAARRMQDEGVDLQPLPGASIWKIPMPTL